MEEMSPEQSRLHLAKTDGHVDFTHAERRALAAINGGGEPPSNALMRFASGVLALAISATAISGGLRIIYWMWWQ